jgi:eukaryotic-like serine/threonine-protein kinase
LWDWRRGAVVRTLSGHKRKTASLAFSSDGKLVLTGSWDHSVRAWDVEGCELAGRPMEHQDLVQSVALGPRRRVALTGGDDYVARLWDVDGANERQIPLKHPDKVRAVSLSPAVYVAATGGKAGRVRLWDVVIGKPLGPPPHAGEVHSLAFDAGGRAL